ncbi:hypothetical protein [Alkalithermobacter paradoxus]|uniref:Uncharacterized protein n=1 Tax=Alkalithermobacter paradoxus TaxID=29349 RepID=A0A1V4IAT5_9FIRM|nr:hypothetical protein CLOTH_00370 [[Clostridium] thermoalcaliphilum]
MSLFLAPIHYWLFNKIKLSEELEKSIIKSHEERFEGIVEVVNESKLKYGDFLSEKPLEEIIDLSNIHGWLQERIRITESRSSYLFKELYSKYGEESKKIVMDEVKKQSLESAKEVNIANSPNEVFDRLNNYILEGMPCDRINAITEQNNTEIVWQQDRCIHEENYKVAHGDIKYMYEIRDVWVKTFVENISPGYVYTVERNGSKSVHKIKIK